MIKKRIIPSLLLWDEYLVKTKQFSEPNPIAEPIYAIKIFNDYEVDEVLIFDIGISKKRHEDKNSAISFELLGKISDESWMPITYGGGIRTLHDIKQLFFGGVEKICINSEAIENPIFITEASKNFGSQSICIGIDIKKENSGEYSIYSHGGMRKTNLDLFEWMKEIEERGAGEILIYSIDRDGMMTGFDIELISTLSKVVEIPVIACGGAGSYADITTIFQKTRVSGAGIGSLFVYYGKKKAVLISYPSKEEIDEITKEVY